MSEGRRRLINEYDSVRYVICAEPIELNRGKLCRY